MFAVVPLMIVLMLATMMLMLVSFRRLAMVVALLPLGLIGVVLALLVFNRPLGFVAILGILALIGMIAKNAVILVVQIETDRAEGRGVLDAVMASATGRLRPMMLAAISTVLGLIPIAPTVFWGPMAFAIMGGLLVATLLTLVLLPVLYVAVFGNEKAPPAAGRERAGVIRRAASHDPKPPRIRGCRRAPATPRRDAGRAVLELRVGEMRQLFNAMDPAPFRERDLDPNAEDVHRRLGARDARRRSRCGSSCTSAREAATPENAAMLRDAVDDYFRQRAEATRRAAAAAVPRRPRQPADRPRVPRRRDRARRVRRRPRRQGRPTAGSSRRAS